MTRIGAIGLLIVLMAASVARAVDTDDPELLKKANAFTALFKASQLTLVGCQKQIRAANTVPDEVLERIAIEEGATAGFEDIDEWISACIHKVTPLTTSDLRGAVNALHRLHKWIEFSAWADGSEYVKKQNEKQQLQRQAGAQANADEINKRWAALVDQYNGLVGRYNTLSEANYRASSALVDCQQNSYYRGMAAGIDAANKVSPPYVPPPVQVITRCRTELIGWDLVTTCQ